MASRGQTQAFPVAPNHHFSVNVEFANAGFLDVAFGKHGLLQETGIWKIRAIRANSFGHSRDFLTRVLVLEWSFADKHR